MVVGVATTTANADARKGPRTRGPRDHCLLPRFLPFRGLFVIDAKGILRQITINDLPVGRSVDETLRLVQAFQFTDKHGEGERSPQRVLSTANLKVSDAKT